MSYAKLIHKNITMVFKLVKDLAKDATLNKRTTSSFNFTDVLPIETAAATLQVKVILLDALKKAEDRNSAKKEALIQYNGVGDISLYSSITIDGVNWNIGPVIKNDGFLYYLELNKEG